jgi:hypothetical protein
MLLISVAFSAELTLSWDADPQADEYRVYISLDNGVTWTLAQASAIHPVVVTGIPDSGLVLMRAVSWSTVSGEITRPASGIWYNGDWNPPFVPANVEVE